MVIDYGMYAKRLNSNLTDVPFCLALLGEFVEGLDELSCIQEPQHPHNTTNNAIDTIVTHAKRLQHHSRRIEAHGHAEKHPHIEHQRVLRNAFIG